MHWIIFYLLLTTSCAFAQLPTYTLYYTNPLPINPALAGSAHQFRAGINFRNQWSNYVSPITAYSVFADNYFSTINSGIGLSIYTDQAGLANFRTTQIATYYAYNAKLNNKIFLKAGIQPAIGFNGQDQGSLTYNDQLSPLSTTGKTGLSSAESAQLGTRKTYFNLNSGLVLTVDRFYIGLSGYNLLMPKIGISSESKLPIGFGLQSGIKIEFLANQISRKEKKERYIMPHVYFSAIGQSKQLYTGAELVYEPFTIGLTIRGNYFSKVADNQNISSTAVSIGFRKKNIQFNYAYDLPISSKTNLLGPSHEVGIRTLLKLWQRPSRRTIDRLDLF